ncbi:hypothetical protein Q4555_07070 [Octadecabacter sp. 1_MG-2023]|uniref:hypothetical protein n=1 Tax=unclassified Octadecabacter TaxID=196158 RepID=UPI001C089B9B|nr:MULTISPECIES: hypothetical protein [unclassified Octadecabacter]MBU2994287.1 hypothetical protein [Octadecabacter sp. B2R22]MDO6734424.1 hypothetical protein [Octadecabacter sp. 1_MG-2023]
MKVTTDTPDLLVVRFTRWKRPLCLSIATLFFSWLALLGLRVPDGGWFIFLLVVCLSVVWTLRAALLSAEKSMLVLNAATGEAELRHRTISGFHRHHWPLGEVQSTRVTRDRRHGPAIEDPTRVITLFVKEGMDEGRHKLTRLPVRAGDALHVSNRVSDWMKEWRSRVDSEASAP